jgi:gluconolactonase
MCLSSSDADDKKPAADKPALKTREIKAGDLKIAVPESWKKRQPKSEMRVAEFEVPPAEGDKETGEFVVFYFQGQGGGLKDNITRWVGQIEPKGREVKLRSGKCELGEYTLVDIRGTYNKSVGPPVLRKTQKLEGWRVINVFLDCQGGPYFFKIDGPEKTVEAELEGLRATFGGNAENEEERNFEEK